MLKFFKFQHFAFHLFRLKAKKGRSIKYWYFIIKVGIDENVGIWLKNKELIKIMKFEDKVGNESNVEIWVQMWKSNKMLKFKWKWGDQSNHQPI